MLTRNRADLVLLVLSLTLVTIPRAQETRKPSDSSEEALVIEQSLDQVSFENDGHSERLASASVRMQSDVGVQKYGVLTFFYARATDTISIDYIRVHKADGTVVTTPLDDVQDMPADVTREAPFYSDLYEKQVAVKGLSIGDLLEYQAHWQSKSLAPGQFWFDFRFQRDAVVREQKIVISVPRERTIKVKSPSLAPSVSEQGARRVYTWKRSNPVRETEPDENLLWSVARGRLPGPDIRISSFQSWDEVARWYDNLQRERAAPSDEVRRKAAQLTANASDDDAKIHALYKYVSTDFRYIGIGFGIGRYQPHFAAEVLTNQYGDCKDKHTLLAALLAASGISAYPALIASRHELDPDIPSPAQFDHVITALPRGKDFAFVDATMEVAPFGFLSSGLREKQTLIVLPGRGGTLQSTPADPPFPVSWAFKIDARLDSAGTLEGKVEQTIHGDLEVYLRAALRNTPRTQWKDLIQQFSYSWGFAGDISDLNVSGTNDNETPLQLTYTYKRKEYPDWANRRFRFPSPSVIPSPAEAEGKLPRMFWLGLSEMTFESHVSLPSEYTSRPILKTDIERDFAGYHASYSVENGVAVARYRIVIKKREVSGAAVADYKNFSESVANDRDRYVSAIPVSGAPEQPSALLYDLMQSVQDLPDSTDFQAQVFERDARAAAVDGRRGAAVDAFQRAVAQDPKFTRGWLLLAQVQLQEHNLYSALDAYHKAIESDPGQALSYKLLAYVLSFYQRTDEAFQVWQDLAKAIPDDPDAPLAVGAALVAKKQYSDAVPPLELAVKANPEKIAPLGQLGIAYLHLGRDADAMVLFEKSLQLRPTAQTRNGVAWNLVLANKELDRALEYAQEAVRDEEDASSKVQLDKLTTEDLPRPLALSAFWDTLGWVHYRMGNVKLAEQYVYPAWTLRQSPAVGYHLGQIYEKEQRRADAIHIYQLVTTLKASNGDDRDALSDVTQCLARLKSSAAPRTALHSEWGSLSNELSDNRTSTLPKLVSKHASAEFFLLFSPGPKLEGVKFISGSDELRSADKALRAAKFKVSFPENSSARLLRRGILACYPITGCSFVLLEPDALRSVN